MLVDETNYTIPLSLHEPMEVDVAAHLNVDADSDSSFDPSHWVYIHLTDDEHDSDRVKLTYEEAGLLHDRLGLILGRKAIHNGEVAEVRFDDGAVLAVVGEKASWANA